METQTFISRFRVGLSRQSLKERTRTFYLSAVAKYCQFVEQQETGLAAFRSPVERDRLVLAYKHHLQNKLKRSNQTINRTLTALNHFYQTLGLGKPNVGKMQQPKPELIAPRPISHIFVPFTPENLKKARNEKKYTLRELGKEAGKSYDYICNLENAKYSPTMEVVRDLGRALDVVFTVGQGPLMELDSRIMKIYRQGLKYDGKKLSLRRLSALTGISYVAVWDFERERARKSRVSTAEKLSAYYGVRFFLL